MRLIDANELLEHAYRDRLDSRELIANMINNAPTIKEIPIKVPLDLVVKALEQESCDKYIKEIDHLRKYISKLETQIVEQEPNTDILDKIKVEIETIEISGMVDANTMYVRSAEQIKNIVIEIIDKYKEG